MPKKPNIILIMTDQQRADLRAGEGFELDPTPSLDALGHTGVDFRKAYTTMPVCGPARVSMLTGRYPNATRVRTNHNIPDATYKKDLVQCVMEQGYRTALCGKNHSHLTADAMDYWHHFGHAGEGGGAPTQQEKEFDDYLARLKHLTDTSPAPFPPECQNPYRIVSSAMQWIDSVKDEPFFLWMSFPEPHNPFQVSEPYFSLFPPESLPPLKSSKEDAAAKGFKYRWMREQWENAIPQFDTVIDRTRSNYLGMLRLIDDQLSRFLSYLDETGLRDDTIIVYTSDHGDFWGEYGLIRKGAGLAETLSRIPLIISGPGVDRYGPEHNAHVSLADLMPTLCEAAGSEIPRGVQGHSLWPLLKNRANTTDFSTAYTEHGFGGAYYDDTDELDLRQEGVLNDGCYLDELNSWTQSGYSRMLREGRFKLIFDMEGNGELYDLENDPAELVNLYADEKFFQIRTRLLEQLLASTLKTQDPLPYPRKRYYFKDPDTRHLSPPTG